MIACTVKCETCQQEFGTILIDPDADPEQTGLWQGIALLHQETYPDHHLVTITDTEEGDALWTVQLAYEQEQAALASKRLTDERQAQLRAFHEQRDAARAQASQQAQINGANEALRQLYRQRGEP